MILSIYSLAVSLPTCLYINGEIRRLKTRLGMYIKIKGQGIVDRNYAVCSYSCEENSHFASR